MMSSAPTPPSMNQRPLQLDHWCNTLAPLSTSQRNSVNQLADWLHRNSSEYVESQSNPPGSDPTGITLVVNQEASVPESGSADQARDDAIHRHRLATPPLNTSTISLPDSRAPLATGQDFLAWYTSLTHSISSATHSSHQNALTSISHTTAEANQLLSQFESCQINVSELRAATAFVQDSSKGLRQDAQTLLDSQLHLDKLTEEISSRLSFFTLLPYSIAVLNSPDSSIVYTNEFLDLLDQLEIALVYLQQEPAKQYRDAVLYRMRYGQCVTRGATLAKLAICKEIKAAGEEMTFKLREYETLTSSAQNSKGKAKENETLETSAATLAIPLALYELVYPDLSSFVVRLGPLLHELEKRAYPDPVSSARIPTSANAAEFESLVQECKTAWVSVRRPVIVKIATGQLEEIQLNALASSKTQPSPDSSSVEQLANEGSVMVCWFLQQEYDHYFKFFQCHPTSPTESAATVNGQSVSAQPFTSVQQSLENDTLLKQYLFSISDVFQSKLRSKLVKQSSPEDGSNPVTLMDWISILK